MLAFGLHTDFAYDLILSLACALMVGCSSAGADHSTSTEVAQPDKRAFAKGADISWATKMESEGLEFFNAEGDARECTVLMRELGMNAVRYRVWVNPVEGWNSKADILAKATRAQELGMRIMIDFHYSDTWADPGSQHPPVAWERYNLTEMKEAVAAHTKDLLSELKGRGVDVEWVQVGNETPDGMLHDLGKISSGTDNFAELVNSGFDAVKSVYPESIVIVHVDKGDDLARQEYVFDYLDRKGARFDMIGVSLYPEPNSWEESAARCIANLKILGDKYNKPTMICEVGMSVSEPQRCGKLLSYLINKGSKDTNGRCKGIFYWEPQAPAGYNGGYMKGAFENGAPTIALDAFRK